MSLASTKDGRGRNWATVVYPESAPENWLDILKDYKSPALVSPLHDKDVNPGGELKKSHYHVILMYEGKNSEDTVRSICSSFGGVGLEHVKSLRGYARYLCHLDNPEKYQYSPDDVLCISGADFEGVCALAIDKYKAISEMMDYVDAEDVLTYKQLCDFARQNKPGWFRVLMDTSTSVLYQYIKSKTWEMFVLPDMLKQQKK